MQEQAILPSGHPRIDHTEMIGITKRFPGVLANDGVTFDVRAHEVHALLGENGAGKSTLMKQLYGLYRPDEGEILFDGKAQTILEPSDAIALGVGMIHQHFMLVDTLTVAQNVALGLPSSRGVLTDLDVVSERIVELAALYGLDVEPDAYTIETTVAEDASYSDALDKAIKLEEKIEKFYTDAAEQSKILIADIPRAFVMIAKKRISRGARLKSFK